MKNKYRIIENRCKFQSQQEVNEYLGPIGMLFYIIFYCILRKPWPKKWISIGASFDTIVEAREYIDNFEQGPVIHQYP